MLQVILTFLQRYPVECYEDLEVRAIFLVKGPHIIRQTFLVLEYLARPGPFHDSYYDNMRTAVVVIMAHLLETRSFGAIPDL